MRRRSAIAIAVVAIGALSAIALVAKTVSTMPSPPATAQIVDLHVHTAGIGAGGSGAFVNREMRENFRFRFYLSAFGVTEEVLNDAGDGVVVARISAQVAASERVAKAIVLAMDGVVDGKGELDREATQIYVPNAFVASQTAAYENLCFGASVNPYRHDALKRLHQAKADGAVLLKWIPNIMHIDPADPAIRPFYEALVELQLPLLSHAGQERSFADAIDRFGDPARLELPLSMGVTVIAAHIATTGENEGESNFERILPMFERFPNLYADISSLTQINKRNYLPRALDVPGLADRLVYGTDWPLQFFPLVSPYYHVNHIGIGAARAVQGIENAWDRDVALKEALGTPADVFPRGADLIAIERCR
ncbi:MAG: amidohydrolase family protein [Gammaproteobacteria bacterium]|nr:amidohydrolase family protein [Gammaproteobacteria bacterium]